MDHNYLLATNTSKKPSTIGRSGSTEYRISPLFNVIFSYSVSFFSPRLDDPSSDESENDDDDDDDERDSNVVQRKSIITTRAQTASRTHSKNRRKSSPPKKRPSLQYPSHRPNTRINRRIIEHDLKLLRQANVLPPLSPPTNQQPLDLSLGPNRSSSCDEIFEKTSTISRKIPLIEDTIEIKDAPIEGVLDLSLSR